MNGFAKNLDKKPMHNAQANFQFLVYLIKFLNSLTYE